MSASQSLLDISLPSIDGVSQSFSTPTRNASSFSIPGVAGVDQTPGPAIRGLRAPSSSSTAPSSAALATPPPPDALSHVNIARGAAVRGASGHGRRKSDLSFSVDKDRYERGDEDISGLDDQGVGLGTGETKGVPTTPANGKRSKAPQKSAVTLTLRDQEKHIDSLKKENFSIKLRVHFLEERLAQLAPEQIDAALKQNINLKIEVQQRGIELKKLKKLVLELEKELERQQRHQQQQQQQQNARSRDVGRERELEDKLRERDREIRELRMRLAKADEGAGERDEEQREALIEAEERNAELETELEGARVLLEENMDEIERLRDIVERGDNTQVSSASSSAVPGASTRRRVEELEAQNEDLADANESLHLTIEDLQARLQDSLRSASRLEISMRHDTDDEMNSLKDRLAAVMIELGIKEEECEERAVEVDELVREHRRIVEDIEEQWKAEVEQWRGEVDEARGQADELKDAIAERDAESESLRLNISELEANTHDLHSKFETALAHLEEEAQAKDELVQTKQAELDAKYSELEARDAEIEAKDAELEMRMNELEVKEEEIGVREQEIEELEERLRGDAVAIERLSDQVYGLQEENDKLREDLDAELAERERLDAMCNALKEKLASLKQQLSFSKEESESLTSDVHAHRARQEELATHIEDLVSSLTQTRSTNNELIRTHKAELSSKEAQLRNALADLDHQTVRARELLEVKDALEKESRSLGESATSERFSLQLEVDRLKRDLERVESELASARNALSTASSSTQSELAQLHSANRDLAAKLSEANQAKINATDRLDVLQKEMSDLRGWRDKYGDVEARLAKEQKGMLSAEGVWRDQLTERNTLLLTVYQYLDKILGVDKTPKKGSQAETKPFTNFSVFHDNLVTRLKSISRIDHEFERRLKDAEARFTDKMGEMKRQIDVRWKQIDRFEASVRTYGETKAQWRKKFAAKEGELEAIRATNTELTSQLTITRKSGTSSSASDAMEIRSLTARAANAERRLINAQNQLAAAEEKMASQGKKTLVADSKWDARVKEYESRLKAAEEKVKRERQGGKERVVELETTLKTLQRQLELAQKRNTQLGDMVDTNKASARDRSS